MREILISLLFIALVGCQSGQKKDEVRGAVLFEEVPTEVSGINFVNQVKNTEQFNIFSYRNFYNGGGVALGDINNDGLPDLYLTQNMGPNQLYLNKGDFKFEDITESAGVAGEKAWSTGVVMVDVNADGLLDIYVCNAGYVSGDDQENELFINNGNLTFSEKAADYQLNENGYTTHAAFFDYDLDGDLDCYLLNNSFMPVNTLNYSNKRELYARDWPVKDFLKGGGDKLLRNDEGLYTDVSESSGIYGSLIGFGLGVTVGDVNGDDWPDLYISNDFFERDYLYINQQDGTFSEEIKDWMEHLSLASMGTDMADINNDGYPEIFATEMLPESDYRRKTTTMFEDYNVYQLKLSRDFYHQYMQNTLQLNNKDKSFSEIAWFSGVAASDWSWGALMFDADNDGYRDIYVCNGVYQDVTDQDFMTFFANDVVQKMALTGKKEDIEKVIEQMPSVPLPNKFFRNQGDLTFVDEGISIGFDATSFSNGAAYGDLDQDGDLDLVVNNLNQQALVYRNHSDALLENHHYLKIKLEGPTPNTFAIGASIRLHRGEEVLSTQVVPSRGFQSSVDYVAVIGLGEHTKMDSLVIIWPDRTRSTVQELGTDTLLSIAYDTSSRKPAKDEVGSEGNQLLVEAAVNFDTHREDAFVDFFEEGLTMRMLSREGPKAAVGDVNGDGREDVLIGGASGFFDELWLQSASGWRKSSGNSFEQGSYYETTAAGLLDADGDGDLDIYLGSGGNNRKRGVKYFSDRLYFNDGKGNFQIQPDALPANGLNTSVVLPIDIDEDGDLDLFVGSRSIPGNYGLPPRSYLFENDGTGKYTDIAKEKAPALEKLGMVTDAVWVNLLGDERPELVVVGEWMSPVVLTLQNGKWEQVATDLSRYSGWWYAVEADDIDGDGDQDLIMGNRGENFYFTGSEEAPARLWLSDFDQNGTIEKIITQNINGRDMPIPMKAELTNQIVSLKKQNLRHTDFANKAIQDLFPSEEMAKAYRLSATSFQSAVALNTGDGGFSVSPLPKEVQFSCISDIYCTDLNGDGRNDLILGGNDAGFTPQFSKLDASFGHVLINDGKGGYDRMENQQSGMTVRGDIKQFIGVSIGDKAHVLTLINQQTARLFKLPE